MGVCEDVLVKVGKFDFPTDFMNIDIAEEASMPLIFGRPFLSTAKAKIDVDKGMISLKLHGKRKKFKVCELKNKPAEHVDAFLVDMMKIWSDESLESFFRKEGTFKKKKPPPIVKKKAPPVEKKPAEMKPEKKGHHPWLFECWKKKVAPEPIRSEKGYDVFYVDCDEEVPHGATHQGYTPR